MAHFDFPDLPNSGDVYAPPGGPVWRWNGQTWRQQSPGGPVSEAPLDHKLYGRKDAAWTPIASTATVSPFQFGGIGNGVSDDRAAIQAAIDYLYTTYIGGEVDMSGGRWLVDSGNINMKAGVTLKGAWRSDGVINNADISNVNWSYDRSCIVLNPAYTINMLEDCCGLEGLSILRKGLETGRPGTLRAQVDAVKAFAGTAVTIGGGVNQQGNEAYVGYCLILGFQYAINSDYAGRPHIQYVTGDCTNGIRISRCYDMNHLSHCHFWPFVTGGVADYAVSGAANNGSGLIRLTVATNVLVTGDSVAVSAVGGTTEANGRWTVTVVDATHIDLQGSAFVNAWTSGGNVNLSAYYRSGRGFWFDDDNDWGQADNCFCYAYAVGFDLYSSDHCELLNCGVDSYSASQDLSIIGIRVKDCVNTKLIGCKTSAQGTGVVIDAGLTSGQPASVAIMGHDFWGIKATGLSVLTGYVTLTNSMFYFMPNGIVVAPASGGICATSNKAASNVTAAVTISGAAMRASTLRLNNWNDATTGERTVSDNVVREVYDQDYSSSTIGRRLVFQKARGTAANPTAAQSADTGVLIRAEFWDGVSAFQPAGSYRIITGANVTSSTSPGQHIWATTAPGSTTLTDRLGMNQAALYPTTDLGMGLGGATLRFQYGFIQYLALTDGMTAPGVLAGQALLYVDSADGDLKVKFSDGVVKTIVVDT